TFAVPIDFVAAWCVLIVAADRSKSREKMPLLLLLHIKKRVRNSSSSNKPYSVTPQSAVGHVLVCGRADDQPTAAFRRDVPQRSGAWRWQSPSTRLPQHQG